MLSNILKHICKVPSQIGNLPERNKTAVVFAAGLLFCVVIVILPELFPAIKGREGSVWSPVHSQNYRLGDLYYYGAWVREVLQSGIPAYSPSAGELSGQPLIETWRFLGLALAALPGLIISDIRVLIVFNFGFSAALFFCIAFLFAHTLTRNRWIALIAGITVLFMTDRLWVPVRPNVENFLESWTIAASAVSALIAYLRYTANFIEYDVYGSTFRFINISMSGPILLAYYFITALAYKNNDIKLFVILLVLSPLMAFTYPSHTIIAYGLIAAFFLVSLYRQNWKVSIAFASVGILTIIILEIIKYRTILSELFTNSELWNNIFASERLVLLDNEIGVIASMLLLNKYLFSFLIMIYLARKNRLLTDIIVATGIIAIPLSAVYIFNLPQLGGRFLSRGIDHIWFMLFVVVTGNAIRQFAFVPPQTTGPVNSRLSFSKHALSAIFMLAFTLFIVVAPAVGFFNLATHTMSSGSRFIPAATMNAYQWIERNVPDNAEVATLDWEDITLLPIFTNVNLVVGHSIIDGRSPEDELERFIGMWKYLGYSRLRFEQLIDSGISSMAFLTQVETYVTLPCLPNEEFDASQFMLGILYWPHIREIGGIKISSEGNMRTITPEFKKFVMDIYDGRTADVFLDMYKVQYLTMSSEQVALLGFPKGMNLIHETKTRSIFARAT